MQSGSSDSLDRWFPLFLCFGCLFKTPQAWQFERSSHKDGRSKETDPQGWEKGIFERPRSFLFQVPLRRFSAHRTQSTTGTPPGRRRYPSNFSPKVGSSSWSSTQLFTYVVLTGDTTMFQDIDERMPTTPAPISMQIKVICPPERNHSM